MLKKVVLALFVLVLVVFLAAQAVRPDLTNPPVQAAMTIDANPAIPADVKPILKKGCADCHTNETRYPWYSHITPVNWWLKDHIDEGRQHMNLSEAVDEIDDICKEVTKGEMPLPSYTWGHPEAVLTAEEKQILCNWAAAPKAGDDAGEGGASAVGQGKKNKENEDDER